MKENSLEPKFRKLTTLQIVEVHAILKESLTVVGEGLVSYKEGISDRTIAAQVGVTQNHVARVRVEGFGKLSVEVPRLSDNEQFTLLKERYRDLMRRHQELWDKVIDVSSRLQKLEDAFK